MMARQAQENASIRPQNRPGSGIDSVLSLPPVASSHTPTNAKATPITSRFVGLRFALTHT